MADTEGEESPAWVDQLRNKSVLRFSILSVWTHLRTEIVSVSLEVHDRSHGVIES